MGLSQIRSAKAAREDLRCCMLAPARCSVMKDRLLFSKNDLPTWFRWVFIEQKLLSCIFTMVHRCWLTLCERHYPGTWDNGAVLISATELQLPEWSWVPTDKSGGKCWVFLKISPFISQCVSIKNSNIFLPGWPQSSDITEREKRHCDCSDPSLLQPLL